MSVDVLLIEAGEELPRLRAVMLANNEIVKNEMERRGSPGENSIS
jgi:hypothetical protein